MNVFPAHRARVVVVCTSTEETTTSKSNSNKHHTWDRLATGEYNHTYGRVGAPGVSHKVSEAKAKAKYLEALRNGYVEADIVDGTSGPEKAPGASQAREAAIKQIGKGNRELEALVTLLADKNVHQLTSATTLTYNAATGLFQTPLGVVGRETIKKARAVLTQAQDAATADDKLATSLLMLIPQDIGRDRPTFDRVFGEDRAKIADLYAITNALEGSLDLIERGALKPADKPKDEPSIFDLNMAPVNVVEMGKIERFFRATFNRQHDVARAGLGPKRAWDVSLSSMESRFLKADTNRMTLWHGTRIGNVLSILSKGLIIPPAGASHCTGRMFGDGLYFSDQSTKSLNYAYGYWDGRAKDNTCFMFMADVAMGRSHIPTGPTRSLPSGYDSIYAQGGRSGVANNEMIVFALNRARLVRLVEFGT